MDNLDPINPVMLKGYLDEYLTGRYGDSNVLETAADFTSHTDEHVDEHSDVHTDRAS
jgi:hypothetical protein